MFSQAIGPTINYVEKYPSVKSTLRDLKDMDSKVLFGRQNLFGQLNQAEKNAEHAAGQILGDKLFIFSSAALPSNAGSTLNLLV